MRTVAVMCLLLTFSAPSLAEEKMSKIVFSEFANLTEEQTLIMAYNYTETLFRPDEPIPINLPTTLAFDPLSPLRSQTSDSLINPNLRDYRLPTEYDFHSFPPDDILAPLYRYERQNKDTVKIILGRKKDPHLVDKDSLATMLENVFTLPRHSERNSSLADSVGQYIMRKFGTLGLLTGTQVFHPSQFHSMFWEKGEKISEGSNIIAIFPGEKFYTAEDKIIVVGAHWDTTGFTDGYNDNGSGLAAMLEVARALVESGCRLKYSVIFVAFDKEEVGSQGSHEFVRGYLVKEFFNGDVWPEFQGAFILDTVMNFNESENSQLMPDEWREKIPDETFQLVKENNFRGDFISLISRTEPERELADLIESHWTDLYTDQEFRLGVTSAPDRFKIRHYKVGLPATLPSLLQLTDHIHFLRSDHARFWYSNETNYQLSLRSVLFTDTGPYRGVMARCYHRECDSARMKNRTHFASYEFLSVTTQTVIDSVTDLSKAQCTNSIRTKKLRNYSPGWKTIKEDNEVPIIDDIDNDLNNLNQEERREDEASSSIENVISNLLLTLILLINLWFRI